MILPNLVEGKGSCPRQKGTLAGNSQRDQGAWDHNTFAPLLKASTSLRTLGSGSVIVCGHDPKSGARQRFDYAFRDMLGLLGAYFAIAVIFASIEHRRRNYRI
jgi:hypothetical protein